MGAAARRAVDQGAQIVDINMGCPAKKVCNRWAGSALLRDEVLVGSILRAVVAAVPGTPVTLKIRTGWDRRHRNAPAIAVLAEDCGIPVIANGDIDGPAKAREVLQHTGADGLMIGRAAQGRPWIFDQINGYLEAGREPVEPDSAWIGSILLQHLRALYEFYGEYRGVRVARKHIGWYCRSHPGSAGFRQAVMRLESAPAQMRAVGEFFDTDSGLDTRAA